VLGVMEMARQPVKAILVCVNGNGASNEQVLQGYVVGSRGKHSCTRMALYWLRAISITPEHPLLGPPSGTDLIGKGGIFAFVWQN